MKYKLFCSETNLDIINDKLKYLLDNVLIIINFEWTSYIDLLTDKYKIEDLTNNGPYYLFVIVSDEADNKALYYPEKAFFK